MFALIFRPIIALTPTCFCTLIITLSTAAHHRREPSTAVLFYMEPRFYPLLRGPIISMISIYLIFLSPALSNSCSLSLSDSLSVVGEMFLFFSVRSGPWSSEMESVQGVCFSLLTADESKNTQIKTSVNCVKGRQTMVFIRGTSR